MIWANLLHLSFNMWADNFAKTVSFCRERIAPDRLLGFLQTAWYPTLPEYRDRHLQAIEQIAVGRADVPLRQLGLFVSF